MQKVSNDIYLLFICLVAWFTPDQLLKLGEFFDISISKLS